MKVFYIDANATTPQYNYPIVEELAKHNIDITLFSTVNQYISDHYIRNYSVKANFLFFKLANKIKNQKLRRVIKVITYPFNSLKLFLLIKNSRPDIVHFNWLAVPPADRILILLIKKLKIPVIITRHDFIPHEFNNLQPGDMNCLMLADLIICLSDQIKRRFPLNMQNKITVIPHGNTYQKEITAFKPAAKKENKIITILLVGNLKPYKGVLLLLQAFKELISERDLPELRIRLAGKCDASLMAKIEYYITNNNLDELVNRDYRFISYDEMFQFVVDSDAGILPYEWGSQSGLPYIFYAFNKPLILSDVCGLAEQGNSRISIITKPVVDDIKKAIIKFIEQKKDYNSQDFIEFLKDNEISSIAAKIKTAYQQIIDQEE